MSGVCAEGRKVDVRLPGKGNPNSLGARPVHLIITMIKWIRTSRLSIKNSLSALRAGERRVRAEQRGGRRAGAPGSQLLLLLHYYSQA